MRRYPKTVVKVGLLSLFTDMSSEMIFPLLPVFLATLPGGGPFVLGVIEGIAESTASFLKLVSGLWTDRIRKRTPFVIFGYGLAGCVRPLIGFAAVWPVVLILRFMDRVGKGLRSSPRDALIADSVPPERRGAAFALQRIMDHSGAVAGPVVASVLMKFLGFSIRQVILFAAIPSVIVIAILSTLKEPSQSSLPQKQSSRDDQPVMSRDFRLLLAAVFVFTLGNSTDAFILLRLSNAGMAVYNVALLWALHHVMKIAGAWVGGRFSDKLGRKTLVFAGFGLYALIYLAFGVIGSWQMLTAVFILYGASIGILEPTERAWVSDLARLDRRGSAFGFYHAVKGFGALPASLIFGILWSRFGQATAFLTGAGLALAASGIVVMIRQNGRQTTIHAKTD